MTTRRHTFTEFAHRRRGYQAGGPVSGVITIAASLNAAGAAAARGGAGPSSIVWGHRAPVSTAQEPLDDRPASGPWLTRREMYCSIDRMNAEQRLVTRDHIDFGRVWSAACCA
ncbi:hypothetical protein [Streptomyces sp. NPDC002520]